MHGSVITAVTISNSVVTIRTGIFRRSKVGPSGTRHAGMRNCSRKTKARGERMIRVFQKNRLVRVKGKDGNPTGKVYRIGDVKREPGKRVHLIQLWSANHLHEDGSCRSYAQGLGWTFPENCVLIQNDDPGLFDEQTLILLRPYVHNQALLKPWVKRIKKHREETGK